MEDLICPFSATLVQEDFGCQHAVGIVRRGGAETACNTEDMHDICCKLHDRVKSTALAKMELEDDLLTLPHSVSLKIQYGGLLGLQNYLQSNVSENTKVSDISILVSKTLEKFITLDDVPYDITSDSIINYKLQRHGRKKR